MKNLLVKDFLRAINDYGYTKLLNEEGGQLALFDGKNGIDEKYNGYVITSIGKDGDFIVLSVKPTIEILTNQIVGFILATTLQHSYNDNGQCVCVIEYKEINEKFGVQIEKQGDLLDRVTDILFDKFNNLLYDTMLEETDLVTYLREEYCYNV